MVVSIPKVTVSERFLQSIHFVEIESKKWFFIIVLIVYLILYEIDFTMVLKLQAGEIRSTDTSAASLNMSTARKKTPPANKKNSRETYIFETFIKFATYLA